MSDAKTWRYFVRGEKTHCWAVIFLDSHGVFAAHSDFGGFSHHWPAHGCKDFREFFVPRENGRPIDLDYFMRKFGAGREKVLDEEATRQAILEHILTCRRRGEYGKEFAREEYERANAVLCPGCFNLDNWCEQTDIDYFYVELFHYDFDWDVKNFVNMILPELSKAIQQELANEAAVVA